MNQHFYCSGAETAKESNEWFTFFTSTWNVLLISDNKCCGKQFNGRKFYTKDSTSAE